MTAPGRKSITHSFVRRLRLDFQKRRLLAVTVAGACILVAASSASALVSSNPSRGSLVERNAATSATTWTTPSNEANPPDVPIAGGAASGNGNFNAVSCVISNHCVAVGGDNNLNGLAAASNDGGSTWSESTVASGLPDLNAVDCASATRCVAVGVAGTSTSSDGGATWQAHTIPSTNTTLLGVSCATTSTCVAVGVSPGNAGPDFGQLLLTMNGGTSWTVPTLPTSVGALGSVDCPSATLCVAVGDQILVSLDGGQTWSKRFVNGGTGALRSVSCASPTVCVALGPNPEGAINAQNGAFAIVSTDGGATWVPVATPAGSSTLSTILCFGGTDCVASGPSLSGTSSPPFFLSSNSGATWSAVSLANGLTAVTSLSCSSTTTCVFTGREGETPIAGGLVGGAQGPTVSVAPVVASQNASAL